MARKSSATKTKPAKVTAPKAKVATASPAAEKPSEGKTVTLTPVPKPTAAAQPKPAPVAAPKATAPKVASVKTPSPDAKPAPAPAQNSDEPVAEIKKPEFLDRAVLRSGVKRRDAKPAIEAAMEEIAEILLRGEALSLPPLGKIKVVKSKDVGQGAKALTLKLRTMKKP